ncbi:6-phosphofructokinase [Brooklawnia sp.]|uniref:6-phosphofructokinase n=1 Tax=Brooklawnia sp. TaxID=2699740 RepID=UPI00311EC2C2
MTNPQASAQPIRIGVLTSGGDAQGMNAAVRAVVRTAISRGAEVFAIFEGYQGMIDGGNGIRPFDWDDVGSILAKGGTIIGTFRSTEFRTREGRLKAARNLVERGIDRLVVIGGDGSLTGLDLMRQEWRGLLDELVGSGQIDSGLAAQHSNLIIAGLVGSIDNDLVGVDSTIGADTALHRIMDAIDALSSTAASHQRSFVLEVMGRHCGYLALAAAIAGGCDYVLIPENPPAEGWEDEMCQILRTARTRGRRDSLVVVAEGATDRQGNPIRSEYVRQVIEDHMHEAARTTILGHVQRGGTPSAYDRWTPTWLGVEAVDELLEPSVPGEAKVIGILGNNVVRLPLAQAIQNTKHVPDLISAGDYAAAMDARGPSYNELDRIFGELSKPAQFAAPEGSKRIGIVHAGGLAPGMNTAAAVATRLGISRGFTMVGILNGFEGLRKGAARELGWDDVEGWIGSGGAELGLRRGVPSMEDLYKLSRSMEDLRLDGLLVIGGWNAYQAAYLMHSERSRYPAFQIPIIAVPASIDNNLPGTELAIGADTALNVSVSSIDMIKMSGAATTRAFIVETMGRYCGFQALMSGLASGAERVYLNEEGVELGELAYDVAWLQRSFAAGRKFFLAIRNERASESYTTEFIGQMLEGASNGVYDVRTHIVGHVQQGGEPTPADRLLAARLVSEALAQLSKALGTHKPTGVYVGLQSSEIVTSPLSHMMDFMDTEHRRPFDQWWMQLRPVLHAVTDDVTRLRRERAPK